MSTVVRFPIPVESVCCKAAASLNRVGNDSVHGREAIRSAAGNLFGIGDGDGPSYHAWWEILPTAKTPTSESSTAGRSDVSGYCLLCAGDSEHNG